MRPEIGREHCRQVAVGPLVRVNGENHLLWDVGGIFCGSGSCAGLGLFLLSDGRLGVDCSAVSSGFETEIFGV